MQNGVGLGGRTWGGGDHCMNSRRYKKNSSLRSPDLQVSETGRVVGVALDAVVGEKSCKAGLKCGGAIIREERKLQERRSSFKNGGCRRVVEDGSQSKTRKAHTCSCTCSNRHSPQSFSRVLQFYSALWLTHLLCPRQQQ